MNLYMQVTCKYSYVIPQPFQYSLVWKNEAVVQGTIHACIWRFSVLLISTFYLSANSMKSTLFK